MGLAQPNGNELGFDIHDYIPDEVITKIASDFSGVLNAAEAAAFLGIKRFLLTQLTRPDLIPTFVREDKALPLYHISALTNFMAALEGLRERGIPRGRLAADRYGSASRKNHDREGGIADYAAQASVALSSCRGRGVSGSARRCGNLA